MKLKQKLTCNFTCLPFCCDVRWCINISSQHMGSLSLFCPASEAIRGLSRSSAGKNGLRFIKLVRVKRWSVNVSRFSAPMIDNLLFTFDSLSSPPRGQPDTATFADCQLVDPDDASEAKWYWFSFLAQCELFASMTGMLGASVCVGLIGPTSVAKTSQ